MLWKGSEWGATVLAQEVESEWGARPPLRSPNHRRKVTLSPGCCDLHIDVALLIQVPIHQASPKRVSRCGPGPKASQLWESLPAQGTSPHPPAGSQRDVRHRARPDEGLALPVAAGPMLGAPNTSPAGLLRSAEDRALWWLLGKREDGHLCAPDPGSPSPRAETTGLWTALTFPQGHIRILVCTAGFQLSASLRIGPR